MHSNQCTQFRYLGQTRKRSKTSSIQNTMLQPLPMTQMTSLILNQLKSKNLSPKPLFQTTGTYQTSSRSSLGVQKSSKREKKPHA